MSHATRDDLHYLQLVGGQGAGVSLGVAHQAKALDKFGLATAVPTTEITVWPQNTAKVYRSTAATMKVSSSSTDDVDTTGTGAWTVQIYGVDGDWEPVQETVDLNGQNEVNTVNQYMIVHRMVVRTAGTGLENAGILYVGTGTVTTGVPAVVECVTPATENQSQVAFYAVPNGAKLLIHDFEVFASTASKVLTAHLAVRPLGEVFQHKANQVLVSNSHLTTFTHPIVIAEKSIVQVMATVNSTTGACAARFAGVLTNLTETQIANL